MARKYKPRPSNRFNDEGKYCEYKGNVPTKPVGLADWVFLAIFVAIAIILSVFAL